LDLLGQGLSMFGRFHCSVEMTRVRGPRPSAANDSDREEDPLDHFLRHVQAQRDQVYRKMEATSGEEASDGYDKNMTVD
jgi:hypothetical protein